MYDLELIHGPVSELPDIYEIVRLMSSSIQGVLYLSMVAMPLLFGPVIKEQVLFTYNFHTAHGGLALLPAALGILLGIAFYMLFSNRMYQFMQNRYTESVRISDTFDADSLVEDLQSRSPEFRIPLMQLGMLIVPVGLLIFGWTARDGIHWTVPLFGLMVYSFGTILAYVSIQTYMVDTFGDYAASAIAAGVVMRGILGCVFGVVGFRLYEKLDYNWATTVLAMLMLIFSPVPAFLYVYGGRLRGRGYSESLRGHR